jgi:cobalamin biosynthesis protein CbiD
MKSVIVVAGLSLLSVTAFAAPKPCEELKTEIAAKLDAKGVKGYELTIVANDAVGDQKVVGTCDGGTKKITYKRN